MPGDLGARHRQGPSPRSSRWAGRRAADPPRARVADDAGVRRARVRHAPVARHTPERAGRAEIGAARRRALCQHDGGRSSPP